MPLSGEIRQPEELNPMHIFTNSQSQADRVRVLPVRVPNQAPNQLPTPEWRKPLALRTGLSLVFLTALASVCGTPMLTAQAPATPAPAAHKVLPSHKNSHPAHSKPSPAHVDPEPAAPPPAPPQPHWPVNERPGQANIVWDSHGLRIDAANSSLHQIMKDVATITGTKVEGLGPDERVFGAYGPGLARDVLSQLLQGAGYNVLMIGDQGKGAPRQIVLSSRHPGDKPPAAAGEEDTTAPEEDDPETQDPPEEPPPAIVRPGLGPGGGPRTPQQMMQEREQRQLEMQQNNQQPH